MPVWVNKTEHSNKFWGYDIVNATDVKVRWGRIGLAGQDQIKSFGSSYERDRFIAKKTKEKEDEGYKKEEEKRLEKEVVAAKALGTQFKIQRFEFAYRVEKPKTAAMELNIIGEYNENQWVYVEVLNSWSKEMSRFLLSTKESIEIDNVSESNRKIFCGSFRPVVSDFVRGVRAYLKHLSEQVVEAVQRRVVGLTSRKLTLDGVVTSNSLVAAGVSASVDVSDEISESTGAAKAVVSRLLGGLGQRKLIL